MLIVEYKQRRERSCENIGQYSGNCSGVVVLIADFKQRRVPSDKSRPYHSYCLTTLYSVMFDRFCHSLPTVEQWRRELKWCELHFPLNSTKSVPHTWRQACRSLNTQVENLSRISVCSYILVSKRRAHLCRTILFNLNRHMADETAFYPLAELLVEETPIPKRAVCSFLF